MITSHRFPLQGRVLSLAPIQNGAASAKVARNSSQRRKAPAAESLSIAALNAGKLSLVRIALPDIFSKRSACNVAAPSPLSIQHQSHAQDDAHIAVTIRPKRLIPGRVYSAPSNLRLRFRHAAIVRHVARISLGSAGGWSGGPAASSSARTVVRSTEPKNLREISSADVIVTSPMCTRAAPRSQSMIGSTGTIGAAGSAARCALVRTRMQQTFVDRLTVRNCLRGSWHSNTIERLGRLSRWFVSRAWSAAKGSISFRPIHLGSIAAIAAQCALTGVKEKPASKAEWSVGRCISMRSTAAIVACVTYAARGLTGTGSKLRIRLHRQRQTLKQPGQSREWPNQGG